MFDYAQWAEPLRDELRHNAERLAAEAGLDTCAQEAWAMYGQAVKEFVGAPPEQGIFCGVALGHADGDAPVNELESAREPLDVFAKWV